MLFPLAGKWIARSTQGLHSSCCSFLDSFGKGGEERKMVSSYVSLLFFLSGILFYKNMTPCAPTLFGIDLR